jgi:predicted ATP-grasp superfamily ATP-dependent carboligase
MASIYFSYLTPFWFRLEEVFVCILLLQLGVGDALGNRILLTDGHYKHALGLARHLSSCGWQVWCVGNRYSENRFSRFFKYIPFDPCEEDQDVKFFQDILQRNSIDVLLPIGASSVIFFSALRSSFSQLTNVILAEHLDILQAFDKLSMAELSLKLGIKSPNTINVLKWKSISCSWDDGFIIKSRNEFKSGCKTKYFSSRKDGLDFIKSLDEETLNNLIVQERIDGRGEAFFGVYSKGRLLTGYTHSRIRETPLSGGSSTCAETTLDVDTFNSGKKILDELNWHGAAMVEFKRDLDTNELYLMEVNPKFWGSLELGISHGVDFSSALKSILNDSQQVAEERRIMVRFQWPFHGDLKHLKVKTLWKPVVCDLFNYKVKKNIYLSDPLPLFTRLLLYSLRMILDLKFFRIIKTFHFRSKKQGIGVALLRQIEESLGFPVSKTLRLHGNFIVGPQISRFGKLFLRLRGVTASVNLQSEFDDVQHKLDFEKHCILPCDEYHQLSADVLLAGVKFLHEQAKEERITYIHCREGVSRAPYLLASYYVSRGYTIEESFGFVSQKRKFINPLPVHIDSIESNLFRLRNLS